MMNKTSVSVIIPTHNRVEQLKLTLNALIQQQSLPQYYEIVVVADGCVDQTADYVNKLESSVSIHLVELSGLGPAAARNAGVKASSGEIIIFLDDDIEVVSTFVKAHVDKHLSTDGLAVVGYLPLQSANSQIWFNQSIQQWWEERFKQLGEDGYRFQYGDIFTGNLSMRSEYFHHVGGFNEDLRCHEDYEFGFRLSQAGINFSFSYEAQGKHHDITDMRRSLRRREAEGKADVYLVQQHPNLRYNLPLCFAPISKSSRFLRWCAFYAPMIGRILCGVLESFLLIFIRLKLSRIWSFIFTHIQDFWYWLGVAQSVSGPDQVKRVYKNRSFTVLNDDGDIMDIDLLENETSVDSWLDLIRNFRPDGVRFKINQTDIAEIPALMGAESIKPATFKKWLREHGSVEIMTGRMFANLQGVEKEGSNHTNFPIMNRFPPNDNDFYSTPRVTREIDLQKVVKPIPVPFGKGLHLLLKSFGAPLGWITIDPINEKEVTTEMIKALFLKKYDWHFLAESRKTTPKPTTQTPISVIVCTRNRPDLLRGCLEALSKLDYSDYEVLIIDNAPSDNASKQMVEEVSATLKKTIRYIREDRPGLDRARNRGIQESTYELIAFVDDDARPDQNWLKTLNLAFSQPNISAVTGPVLPAELDTKYQSLFEFAYGGMSHGFKRRFIRGSQLSPVDKLWASGFGVGANMAFRKKIFEQIGLFDIALDVGTPSNGAGDVEMLHRIVAKQKNILYEPRAYVWHYHRSKASDLHQLAYNNGRSFGIYLITCARNRTVSRRWITWFALKYWLKDWVFARLINPKDLPRSFVWSELKGAISSPIGYIATQRHTRKINSTYSTNNLPTDHRLDEIQVSKKPTV